MKKITVNCMIVLISISPLFRGLYFNYETYAFLAALSLLSFLYYLNKIRNSESVHINKLYMGLGILLVAANILSFINALNPRENLESILMYAELAIVFHVLFDYFYEKKQQFIKEIMLSMVLVGFVCAIIGLEALTGSFDFLNITLFNSRLGTTFQYTNTASIYFSICVLFSLTFANTVKSQILKGLLTGVGNIFVLALFLTGSRGGFLVGMASILLFLLIQPRGYKLKGFVYFISMLIPLFITVNIFNKSASNHDFLISTVWLAISFILAAILSLIFYLISRLIYKIVIKNKSISLPKNSVLISIVVFVTVTIIFIVFREKLISLLPAVLSSRLENLSLNDPNVLYRLEFDKDAMKLIVDNWLLGLGGGGWEITYQSVQDIFYTASFVHNNYLQIFLEVGIFGFLAYMALVFFTFLHALFSYIKAIDIVHKVYSAGLLCGFLVLAIHSSFDFDLSYVSLSLLFWVIFAASSVGYAAKESESMESISKLLLIDKFNLFSNKNIYKIIPIALCAILFSIYTLFFTGAYNGHEGLKYMESKNYKAAMLYYEEANRLDTENADYLLELSILYNHFAKVSKNDEEKDIWLEKAKTVGEKSVSRNGYYPPQIKTLIQTYRDLDMPLKFLEYSQKLVLFQRCNSSNYELLARSYLDAAKYYERNNDIAKAKELLIKCIEIKENADLLKSNASISKKMVKEKETSYKPSEILEEYFNEASNLLKKFK